MASATPDDEWLIDMCAKLIVSVDHRKTRPAGCWRLVHRSGQPAVVLGMAGAGSRATKRCRVLLECQRSGHISVHSWKELVRHAACAICQSWGCAMGHRKQQAGFSVVEMVTAVGLTTICSLVALPNASKMLDQYRLMAAANQLSFEISRAHMQAVGRNLFVRIRLLDGGRYVREYSNDNVTFTQDGPCSQLPAGLIVRTGSSGTPSFNRGGLASAATTITLSNESGYKTVHTNILGRVTIRTTGSDHETACQ